MEYKHSSSTAKAGLTTGIIGSSLGALNLLGNGMGSILGTRNAVCNEDHPVDRYTLDLQMKNAELETKNSFLESNIYTDKKSLEIYDNLNGKINALEKQLCAQEVLNQKTADSFQLVSERMTCLGDELKNRIKEECRERRCADNTIVTYANATFVPHQIAGYQVSEEMTTQRVYNPLPMECCN